MTEGEDDDEGVLLGTITITRHMTEIGVVDYVEAIAADGEPIPLTEALGIMRLAEDTLIREAMEDG